MIDLGDWANERYRVPVNDQDKSEPPESDEQP